jgi:hypothetical protein
MKKKWAMSVRSGDPLQSIACARQTGPGTVLWVRGRPTARRNDSGEIIGWYGLVEDIDARKRAAGAARRAEEPPSVE